MFYCWRGEHLPALYAVSDRQSGMKSCPPSGGDTFNAFSGHGGRYLDNVIAWPSTEPADDYTALSILVFAQQAS